jgi:hypothetical protein
VRRTLGWLALIGIALLGVAAIYAYRQVTRSKSSASDDMHVLFRPAAAVACSRRAAP